jgi:hypothetical protein
MRKIERNIIKNTYLGNNSSKKMRKIERNIIKNTYFGKTIFLVMKANGKMANAMAKESSITKMVN